MDEPLPSKTGDADAEQHSPEELRRLWSDYMIEGARFNDMDDVVEALGNNADVNAVDSSGNTALHMAAANGHADIARVLLAAGANTEQANESGNTALHWACVGGSADLVKVLLDHGANPSALNAADNTPLDGALEDQVILLIFQQHAAKTGLGTLGAGPDKPSSHGGEPDETPGHNDDDEVEELACRVDDTSL